MTVKELRVAQERRAAMSQQSSRTDPLEVFVGEWSMEASFDAGAPDDGDARADFEWLSGGSFLVQRWSVPMPEAPDGIAIIGLDPSTKDRYLQHYFDSRGVARVYRMTLDDHVWTLQRDEPDFSPLEFQQRYVGDISGDGRTITGRWEICHDGATWHRDFDLSYYKLS
jgi:hypothetical protein